MRYDPGVEGTLEFRGALICEQQITFAVVEVPLDVLVRGGERLAEERARYVPVFGDVPIILAARGRDRRARFSGRPDIVRFLSSAGWYRIPWRRYRARRKDRSRFRAERAPTR